MNRSSKHNGIYGVIYISNDYVEYLNKYLIYKQKYLYFVNNRTKLLEKI